MTPSPLENHVSVVADLLRAFKTNQGIADAINALNLGFTTSEASVRRMILADDELKPLADLRRLNNEVREAAENYRFEVKDENTIEVTLPEEEKDSPKYMTIEDVMARHKLNPEEWEASHVIPNAWEGQRKGGTKITFHQFKFTLKRKVPLKLIFPAKIGQSKFSTPKPVDPSEPILTVVLTDPQAPFMLPELQELALRFMRKNQPHRGVFGGDILDLGYISRHRDDPAWNATVQECIDSGTSMIEQIRNACEGTAWSLLKGNHDDRLRNEQLERNERLYGIRPGVLEDEDPKEPVYSYNNLLRLNDLGVEYEEPEGTYEFTQIPLSSLIAVRHGHKTAKGKAAMQTADELGHSVVLGHTHRQSITRKTKWNSITGIWNVITAVEAGCMCTSEGGIGYANAGCPDWQPGFATVTTWPDGGFTAELATFEQNGILRWRDQRYTL